MRTAPAKGTALATPSMPQTASEQRQHTRTHPDGPRADPGVYRYPGSYLRWRDYGQRAAQQEQAARRRRQRARSLWLRVHPEDAINLTDYLREVSP